MNRLDDQYKSLLFRVLTEGVSKDDRTGTGTRSVFGEQIKHDMSEGFPILTTKKVAFKTMVTELKWFLKGDTNIKYLVDNNCNIWNGDAFNNYKSNGGKIDNQADFIDKIKGFPQDSHFVSKHGELGPIYGAGWRRWKTQGGTIDQLAELVKGLKENPESRRHLVSAWNVGELDQMYLPPCHYSFQCYVADGKLSLMWNQRSCDTPLGLPFNIASYGLLLLLLCRETGYEPGELIGNLGDTHIYNNQVEGAKEQLDRQAYELPEVVLSRVDLLAGEFDVELVGYEHHPSIKMPLSN